MDAMIDIETLGVRPTSLILSIGVTVFDRKEEQSFDELLQQQTNYWVIKQPLVYSCIFDGQMDTFKLLHGSHFTFDKSTFDWWTEKHREGLINLFAASESEGVGLVDALNNLNKVIISQRINKVWGNSPSFDCVILRNAFAVTEAGAGEPAWPFWDERDLRTLLDEKKVNKGNFVQSSFIPHRADHDAAFQARLVQHATQK